MAGKSRLDFLDETGSKYAEVTDYERLECAISVNRPGLLEARLLANHAVLSELAYGHMIEVWRQDVPNGVDWYRHYGGRYIEPDWSQPGKTAYNEITADGYLSMLDWRIVAWPAGIDNRSVFSDAAETICKTLVSYNAGSAATVANGRIREGAISGLTVEADSGGGDDHELSCFADGLLDTLQELSYTYNDGDFDLVRGSGAAWEFRWYAGQLGDDHSGTVVFSLGNGNMGRPRYRIARRREKTVCIVGGQGEETLRTFTVRTGANYSAGNDREMFYNGSSQRDNADNIGDTALKRNEAIEEFGFDILQTPETMFGVHYGLGDLVTAVNPFSGTSIVQQVDTVVLRHESQRAEEIIIRTVTR